MTGRSRGALWFEFSRPFTLVAPALGFASGAVTAAGAAPREAWSADLLLYPLIGLTMAAVLNAASNAINQIYDLEIDRINKPRRPLPSGRLAIRDAWAFTLATYAVALALAWFVAPGGRHECFWIVLVATAITLLYSVPPFRTKRLGIWANVTIAIPRGVLLKVAGWSAVKTVVAVEPWFIGGRGCPRGVPHAAHHLRRPQGGLDDLAVVRGAVPPDWRRSADRDPDGPLRPAPRAVGRNDGVWRLRLLSHAQAPGRACG
jgi:4-hydroxybenzoate polyprenyltransferase